jgi:NAD(P)-dependent dehydrogenase (short-subunit alcohol dehydrogenase family)
MDGKVIVITGALGALGQVVLETAVTRGARVAGVDHAKSEVAATNSRLEIGGVDLTDEHAARTAIEAVAGHFGRIDALVNIAGGFAFEAIAEGDSKTWQRMYALNVLTALNASRAALSHLASSGAGRIVNVGAMGALQAGSGMGAYAACIVSPRRSRRSGRAVLRSTRFCPPSSTLQPTAPACPGRISESG